MAEDGFDAGLVEDFAVLFGGEEAGAKAVHADAFGGELAGDVLGEVEDRTLRCRVDEDAREGAVTGDAADVHDRAAAGIGHVAAEDLAGDVRGVEVGLDDLVEVFVGDFEVWRGGIDARAIDERVDAAVLAGDGVEEVLDGLAADGVDFDEGGFAAKVLDLGYALVAALGAAAGDDDSGTGLSEAAAELAAEDAGATDDDGDLVVEAEEFL